jgi:hypothetical protein
MHNKVVYHAAKAFSSFGLPVLRFNFRGTGLSEGTSTTMGAARSTTYARHWTGWTRQYDLPCCSRGSRSGRTSVCARVAAMLAYRGWSGSDCLCAPRAATIVRIPSRLRQRSQAVHQRRPRRVQPARRAGGGVLVSAAEPKQIVWVAGADHFFAGIADSPNSKLEVMNAAMRLDCGLGRRTNGNLVLRRRLRPAGREMRHPLATIPPPAPGLVGGTMA